jgi:hypothetical protein
MHLGTRKLILRMMLLKLSVISSKPDIVPLREHGRSNTVTQRNVTRRNATDVNMDKQGTGVEFLSRIDRVALLGTTAGMRR